MKTKIPSNHQPIKHHRGARLRNLPQDETACLLEWKGQTTFGMAFKNANTFPSTRQWTQQVGRLKPPANLPTPPYRQEIQKLICSGARTEALAKITTSAPLISLLLFAFRN
ncbi:hypothetical protein TNCV_2034921 [Trichonephila clavipes]|nr:hypothetical protein TNCV_2034921 [Trichonephila clavipes]